LSLSSVSYPFYRWSLDGFVESASISFYPYFVYLEQAVTIVRVTVTIFVKEGDKRCDGEREVVGKRNNVGGSRKSRRIRDVG